MKTYTKTYTHILSTAGTTGFKGVCDLGSHYGSMRKMQTLAHHSTQVERLLPLESAILGVYIKNMCPLECYRIREYVPKTYTITYTYQSVVICVSLSCKRLITKDIKEYTFSKTQYLCGIQNLGTRKIRVRFLCIRHIITEINKNLHRFIGKLTIGY